MRQILPHTGGYMSFLLIFLEVGLMKNLFPMKLSKIIFPAILFLVAATSILLYCIRRGECANPSDWTIGNFVQMNSSDSVVTQDGSGIFYCPASQNNVCWENGEIINSSAIVRHDSLFLFFSVSEYAGINAEQAVSRVGYSVSTDGIHFKRIVRPVLYPDRDQQIDYEWMGGCEAPRVSETNDGRYLMFYTQCNRSCKRLAVATSSDLKTWTKHGPIFRKAYNGKYGNTDSKFASIVSRVVKGKPFVQKINGKYYLYWGSDNLYAAVSENLIDWIPVEDENGDLKKILSPRNNSFDSNLIASGPSAVMTSKGIVLFYSGQNREGAFGDKSYPGQMLGGGQALFSAQKPEKLLARSDQPFVYFKDILGKNTNNRSTPLFLQGLACFKGKWYLFYGNRGLPARIAVCNLKDSELF